MGLSDTWALACSAEEEYPRSSAATPSGKLDNMSYGHKFGDMA